MRLVEPLGLLEGDAAQEAVRSGLARWLSGGPMAFTLARLIGDDNSTMVPVSAVPDSWQAALARIAAAAPAWGGLDPTRPAVMGILNVTPDSFSDGGIHAGLDAAVSAGLAMAGAGADMVDVGGESTRPGAAPVEPVVEQARVVPVIRALAAHGVRVSVDTRNAATMAAALDAGAAAVNDISGLSYDPAAASLVARRGCPVVLMHMRGDPATMAEHARYDDVARAVTGELAARVGRAVAAGIAPDRIAVDPGIGFAKTGEHNLELLARLPLLANLGHRILVGLSRKGFVGRLTGVAAAWQRDAGSLALGMRAIAAGASILRVHEVAGTVQAVRTRATPLA
jgi:dihydropteroate synthase